MLPLLIHFFLCITVVSANSRLFFSDFIADMKAAGYPVDYINRAAGELGSVAFADPEGDYNTHYSVFWNALKLPSYLSDSSGHLRENLRATDIGWLYHEFWHVYFHRIAKGNDRFLERFSEEAFNLYRNLSFGAAMECFEEAIGTFISDVVSHFAQLQRELPASSEEERARLCRRFRVRTLQEVINDNYSGYYTDWRLRLVYVPDIFLTGRQKQWILDSLFENKMNY